MALDHAQFGEDGQHDRLHFWVSLHKELRVHQKFFDLSLDEIFIVAVENVLSVLAVGHRQVDLEREILQVI